MAKDQESKIGSYIERKVLPIATKVGAYKPLIAIRDGIALAMPLIIVGSFFMILNNFPVTSWMDWLSNTVINDTSIADVFNKITNGSFGLLGMIGTFGIASSFAEQHGTDGKSAGIIAVASYFIVTPSIMSAGKTPLEGMPYDYLGSKGLFIGIVIGLLSASIFQWFINHDVQVHMPDSVPPAISKSFSALIPGAVIVALFGAIYAIFTWANWGNVHDLLLHVFAKPLGLLSDTLGGTVVAIALNSLFWFVGIHGGNVINNIIQPMWLMNTDTNRVLQKAGNLDLGHGGHIITQPFMDNFVYLGGGGATLGLVLAIGILVISKRASEQAETLAPLTITPGIFNINEPTMFGLPVVLNVTLLIPFIIAPMVNAVLTYIAMATGLVPLCTGAVIAWTMPPVISGFLATSSWTGSVLQVICIVIDVLIYLPFVVTLNTKQKMQEAKA